MKYVMVTKESIELLKKEWSEYCQRLNNAVDDINRRASIVIETEASDDLLNNKYSSESVHTWKFDSLNNLATWKINFLETISKKKRNVEQLISNLEVKKFYEDMIGKHFYLRTWEETFEETVAAEEKVFLSIFGMWWEPEFYTVKHREDFDPTQAVFTEWKEDNN